MPLTLDSGRGKGSSGGRITPVAVGVAKPCSSKTVSKSTPSGRDGASGNGCCPNGIVSGDFTGGKSTVIGGAGCPPVISIISSSNLIDCSSPDPKVFLY